MRPLAGVMCHGSIRMAALEGVVPLPPFMVLVRGAWAASKGLGGGRLRSVNGR